MANKTLTAVATWDDPKSPVNGDSDDQAYDEDCHQRAANRAQFIHAAVLAAGGSGAVKVRTAASVAALKALTGMSAGDVALIADTGGRLYQFRVAAAWGGGAAPFVYAADDATGYWIASTLRNEVVEVAHVAVDNIDTTVGAYMAITGDTNWHDLTDGVTPMSLPISADLLEDDIVEVEAHFNAGGDGSSTAVFRAVVNYSASDHEVEGSGAYSGGGTDNYAMNCSGRYVVPGGGASTATVKLQGKVSNGANTVTVGDTSVILAYKVIRPGP